MLQVAQSPSFFLEIVHQRPQDSAGHHALVYSFSSFACRDGGLPPGGHLFPPAGHLLELNQSNVSYNLSIVHLFLTLSIATLCFEFYLIFFRIILLHEKKSDSIGSMGHWAAHIDLFYLIYMSNHMTLE